MMYHKGYIGIAEPNPCTLGCSKLCLSFII